MDNSTGLEIILKNQETGIITKIEEKGIQLVEKNPFFKDLSELMSDKKVANFFDKYFKNMDDIKTTVIYMKLFRLFQKRYKNVTDEELSKYVNIYLLHHAMTNKDIRGQLVRATMDHLNNNNLPILNLTPEILKKQKKNLKFRKKMERFFMEELKD